MIYQLQMLDPCFKELEKFRFALGICQYTKVLENIGKEMTVTDYRQTEDDLESAEWHLASGSGQ